MHIPFGGDLTAELEKVADRIKSSDKAAALEFVLSVLEQDSQYVQHRNAFYDGTIKQLDARVAENKLAAADDITAHQLKFFEQIEQDANYQKFYQFFNATPESVKETIREYLVKAQIDNLENEELQLLKEQLHLLREQEARAITPEQAKKIDAIEQKLTTLEKNAQLVTDAAERKRANEALAKLRSQERGLKNLVTCFNNEIYQNFENKKFMQVLITSNKPTLKHPFVMEQNRIVIQKAEFTDNGLCQKGDRTELKVRVKPYYRIEKLALEKVQIQGHYQISVNGEVKLRVPEHFENLKLDRTALFGQSSYGLRTSPHFAVPITQSQEDLKTPIDLTPALHRDGFVEIDFVIVNCQEYNVDMSLTFQEKK